MIDVGAVVQLAVDVNVNPVAPPGAERFQWLLGIFSWFCYIAAVAALVYAGGRFAWEKFHRGGDLQSPKMILAALIGGIIMALAPTLISSASGL